jgi:hypothetical protein
MSKLFLTVMLGAATLSADIVNVALQSNGGVAASSSNYLGAYPAGFGNDGGFFNIFHTNSEKNAWWDVTFSQDYYVTSTKLFNRTECCSERASPFSLFLYDSGGSVVWSSTNNSFGGPTAEFTGINTQGRRMRVQLDGTDYLHMREVEVYADTLGGGPTVVPERSTYAILGASVLGLLWRRKALKKSR